MKHTKKITSVILLVVLVLSLVACDKATKQTDLWANAKYQADTELGTGKKTAVVEVTADEKTVTFTIRTDKETVGDALLEHGLVTGEDSEYGLFIKEVNGIVADFDIDKTYWAFYENGEYAIKSVDTTEITEGVAYRLVRSK